jgi:site-specific recombinase XerD
VTGKEYIFPIINENMNIREQYDAIAQFIKTTNKYLKRVTEALEWKFVVTTYYARHSFATHLMRAGSSVPFISGALGHSTIPTTEIYLSGFSDDAVKQNAELLMDFGK